MTTLGVDASPVGPGDILDRHVIVEEVGRGSTASVFRARNLDSGQDVALKLLRPDLALVESAVSMFADEARIASRIVHPNVARVLSTGAHQGAPFIVQELVEGLSYSEARARAADRGLRFELAAHLSVLAQAAEGLHAAHETRGDDGQSLNIVHRDVKPENILLGLDGRVKVVDFGIAAARDRSTRTATGATKGTLAYLAPEQILSPRDVDRRADLWALGVVAWEALSERRLFFDKMEGLTIWNVVHQEIPALEVGGRLPEPVVRVIQRCLSRDRAARPASAAAVAELFEAGAQTAGQSGTALVARLLAGLSATAG
ncbi:MAG: serine/threonine protein kinase [Myxococcales bacterium]|nr:serine/threonine protein kinase [Myxococcales bacterium]